MERSPDPLRYGPERGHALEALLAGLAADRVGSAALPVRGIAYPYAARWGHDGSL